MPYYVGKKDRKFSFILHFTNKGFENYTKLLLKNLVALKTSKALRGFKARSELEPLKL